MSPDEKNALHLDIYKHQIQKDKTMKKDKMRKDNKQEMLQNKSIHPMKRGNLLINNDHQDLPNW